MPRNSCPQWWTARHEDIYLAAQNLNTRLDGSVGPAETKSRSQHCSCGRPCRCFLLNSVLMPVNTAQPIKKTNRNTQTENLELSIKPSSRNSSYTFVKMPSYSQNLPQNRWIWTLSYSISCTSPWQVLQANSPTCLHINTHDSTLARSRMLKAYTIKILLLSITYLLAQNVTETPATKNTKKRVKEPEYYSCEK